MMNGMCGIEALAVRSPFQGSGFAVIHTQGVALGCDRPRRWRSDRPSFPWLFWLLSPFSFFRPKGANYRSPGQRPGFDAHTNDRALKGRPNSRRAEIAE